MPENTIVAVFTPIHTMQRVQSVPGSIPAIQAGSDGISVEIEERIRTLERGVSDLNSWRATVTEEVANIKETTTLIQEETRTLRSDLKDELFQLRSKYEKLWSQDKCSFYQVVFGSVSLVFIIYYAISTWHILISR